MRVTLDTWMRLLLVATITASFATGAQVVADEVIVTHASDLSVPGQARSIALLGHYAYVASRTAGLQIVDITDPSQPHLAGSIDTPGDARDVALAGTYAYVADFDSGLQIIDVALPATPFLVGHYGTFGRALGVAVAGAYVCVLTHWDCGLLEGCGALEVLNVADPQNPISVARFDDPFLPWSLEAAGNRVYWVYTTDIDGGLWIYDLTDPVTPRGGHFAAPLWTSDVAVEGTCAYLAASYSVEIIDVSDPSAPSSAGAMATQWARTVAVLGGYMFMTDAPAGLRIANVADAAHPYQAGSFPWPGVVEDLAVKGSCIYVLDSAGIHTLALEYQFERGEINGDGTVNAADIVYLVRHLFRGGDPPQPVFQSGDVDCDGELDLADIIRLVSYLFKGGLPPGC